MAAKRFGPMKDFARAKKPRLDVSVTRSSTRPSPPRSIMDFWDDDDDVILMATQRAEAEIEAEERKRRAGEGEVEAPNNTRSEITFSEFAPTVQGCTSTQQMFPPPPPPAKKSNALDLEEIFADDDDFDFLAVTLMDSEPPKPVEQVQPSTSSGSRISIHQKSTTSTTTINFTQSRQQEHQIKFLMDRIEALKRDKSKLEKDLGDSNERNEIRSGEVSLLRDELKHLRQQLQVSKMEKLALADEKNRDCNKKVAEAAKQIAAKDIELKIKNAEYSKLKTQQRAHEKSLNMSMNMNMNMSMAAIVPPDATEQRTLLRLNRLNIHRSVPRLRRADSGIDFEYDEVRDQEQRQKKRSLFETELKQLLLHYAQLQAQPESLDHLIPRILSTVGKVFLEFSSYAQSLKFPPNCTLYPYNPYNLDMEPEVQRISLTQRGHLFEGERASVLRRYISTLALIGRQHKEISSALLKWKHNEEFGLLELATEAVVKLGFCNDLSEHFGLLEALAALLNSLLLLLEEEDLLKEKEEPMFELLRQLVFTRPSPWVFKELSSCLLSANRQAQLMARMCVKSPRNCFVSDRVRSIYRFAPDSCLLQVYAGLLELCFFSETPLRRDHFQLLLEIGGNHVRFAFECFKNPPDFILEMLPYFADDEDQEQDQTTTLQASVSNGSTSASASNSHLNGNSNSSSSQRSNSSKVNECECYVKLCLSAVTIVFQMMHQWMLHERKAGTETVGEISRVAVHLLNLIFHEYYLTCLFRDSEETTKHYLSLICSWWREHADILGFQPIQLRLLGRLETSHFMLKPLHQEANPKNPANDLAEWSRIVKDADTQRANNSTQISYNSKLLNGDFFAGLKQVDYTFE
ncbi:ATR-interacting protein mus304 [Drosophila kikkawai]|uniref:ATR-interacting protein mus304 n=1 Tax=Drosophila kikkawai TaxID=30033 RepID=A0A6P4J8T8_DROKI|nr:ATR-interacting protein mus304 [Drosophila kikkawai]